MFHLLRSNCSRHERRHAEKLPLPQSHRSRYGPPKAILHRRLWRTNLPCVPRRPHTIRPVRTPQKPRKRRLQLIRLVRRPPINSSSNRASPSQSVEKHQSSAVVLVPSTKCWRTVSGTCMTYVLTVGALTRTSLTVRYIYIAILTDLSYTHTHTPSLRLDPWSDRYCLCLLATQQLRTHFLSTRGLRLLSLLRNFGGSTSHAWWWGSRVRERCGLATQGTIVTL
jgi:hypothetical protein